MGIDNEKSHVHGEILVVEDYPPALEFMSTILTKAGYQVRVSIDGENALDSVQAKLPDLILMDINMPGMSGIDVCRLLKDDLETKNVPIIFLSALEEIDLKVKALEAGGVDYVTKPIGSSEILARVNTHLTMYFLQQKLEAQSQELIVKIEERKKEQEKIARIEKQYHQAQKLEALGQLAAGLAHEFNNPLSFISSNLDALSNYMKTLDVLIKDYQNLGKSMRNSSQENLSDEIIKQIQDISAYEKNMAIDYLREDIPELVKDCRDGTERIGKIVNDFKSFAHPGKGKPMFTNINKSLESTLNIAAHELKDKTTISKDFGEIPLIEGFPQKLNQAFLSILMNAAHAIEEKGEIRIQTKTENENVIISISDNGCGIEKENLPKIFDPFFTTKEIGRGLGLGLNSTYNIIEQHRGMIHVESSVGKGTAVTITLPGKLKKSDNVLKDGIS